MDIKIYADFNGQDELGRIWLNTVGSKKDLDHYNNLIKPGLTVTLYMDEIEVDGVLVFEEIWLAVPLWETVRYIDSV